MSFVNPLFILSILIAISVHECAHAFVADKLGDPTPRSAGRLTLNPLSHLDWMGALMFLIVGFGWAQPVPVDSRFFRHPKQGLVLTALAGPASNFLLALFSFIALALISGEHSLSFSELLDQGTRSSQLVAFLISFLQSFLFVNLGLMAFNLLPIAPLDGSNIVRLFVPYAFEDQYEQFTRIGPMILIGLIIAESFLPIAILSGWVHVIMDGTLSLFSLLPLP